MTGRGRAGEWMAQGGVTADCRNRLESFGEERSRANLVAVCQTSGLRTVIGPLLRLAIRRTDCPQMQKLKAAVRVDRRDDATTLERSAARPARMCPRSGDPGCPRHARTRPWTVRARRSTASSVSGGRIAVHWLGHVPRGLHCGLDVHGDRGPPGESACALGLISLPWKPIEGGAGGTWYGESQRCPSD